MPTTAEAHFRATAPHYMKLLRADFGLSLEDAAAVFGNLGHESLGLTVLQEINPTVKGSRGGTGWAQWTGPRRRAFEAWCKKHGKDPAADDTNYAYLFVELKGGEKGAITKTKTAPTLDAKVVAFEKAFLRAGVKHYPSRKRWAAIALSAYRAATPEPAVEEFEEAFTVTPKEPAMSNRPILDAIKAGTKAVLNREHVDVAAADVQSVTNEVMTEVAPRIQNATNQEKPWQSRIYIGLGTLVLGFIGNKLGWQFADGDVQLFIDLGTQAMQIWGTAYAAYGRIVGGSKKPLGV